MHCSLPPHESSGSHVSEWISIVRYPILASCSIDYCMFFFWYIHCTKGDSCSIMAPLISLEHWHHTHIHTHCQCRPRPILIIIKLCLCLSALPTRACCVAAGRRGEGRDVNVTKPSNARSRRAEQEPTVGNGHHHDDGDPEFARSRGCQV